MDQNGTGMKVGLGHGRIVLDGDPAPPCRKGDRAPSQFSAHFYCGQTAVCITIPLGTEVGLSLGDIVLDGDPTLPPPKGHSPSPIFGQCPLWPNGWRDNDATWYGGRPRPRRVRVRWEPSSAQPHSIFGPSLLWPNGWMDQDATWYGGKSRPRRRCVRWCRSSRLKGAQPPSFWSMSIVAKRL